MKPLVLPFFIDRCQKKIENFSHSSAPGKKWWKTVDEKCKSRLGEIYSVVLGNFGGVIINYSESEGLTCRVEFFIIIIMVIFNKLVIKK